MVNCTDRCHSDGMALFTVVSGFSDMGAPCCASCQGACLGASAFYPGDANFFPAKCGTRPTFVRLCRRTVLAILIDINATVCQPWPVLCLSDPQHNTIATRTSVTASKATPAEMDPLLLPARQIRGQSELCACKRDRVAFCNF